MIDGWSWAIIIVVATVIILFGPKVPELAKALYRVRGELGRVPKEFSRAVAVEPQAGRAPSVYTGVVRVLIKSSDELLLDAARRLGIETEGKDREQLRREISLRAKLLTSL